MQVCVVNPYMFLYRDLLYYCLFTRRNLGIRSMFSWGWVSVNALCHLFNKGLG